MRHVQLSGCVAKRVNPKKIVTLPSVKEGRDMTLIASISGIRGTIGGKPNEGLSPFSVVRFTAAYAFWLRGRCGRTDAKVVVGRDARISGTMVSQAVSATLQGCGISVLDIGYATTPTVEMAVTHLQAQGGIIITASHNGREWNALKLLNEQGEFLSAADGESILKAGIDDSYIFPPIDEIGSYSQVEGALDHHIDSILKLPLVDTEAIRNAKFKVGYDAINSVGALALPRLLERLGVENYVGINTELTGDFAHTPEPLPENLTSLSELVPEQGLDVGFAVDPDVDRLAIICEDGAMFGEEYTLVSVADYVLSRQPGNTVSNLSSTSALRDVTAVRGAAYYAAPVGEVNVVARMKEVKAVIGGEGNGGVIYPALHYGRDALVGIALFLSQMARTRKTPSALRSQYPSYFIAKKKISLPAGVNADAVLDKVKRLFASERLNTEDGVRIDMKGGWVHLRRSNTEPIVRVYAESASQEQAEELAQSVIDQVMEMI